MFSQQDVLKKALFDEQMSMARTAAHKVTALGNFGIVTLQPNVSNRRSMLRKPKLKIVDSKERKSVQTCGGVYA